MANMGGVPSLATCICVYSCCGPFPRSSREDSRANVRCSEDDVSWMFSLAEDTLYTCGHVSTLLLYVYLNLAFALSQLKRIMYQLRKAVVSVGIFRVFYNKSNVCPTILSIPNCWPRFPVGNRKETRKRWRCCIVDDMISHPNWKNLKYTMWLSCHW